MKTQPSQPVVFYDNNCGFCQRSVQLILKLDKKQQFLFAPLDGETAHQFALERNFSLTNTDSLIFWIPTKAYWMKSTAVFEIASRLPAPWFLVGVFKYLPRFWMDFIYDLIAKNRSRFSSSNCRIPTTVESRRFLK